MSKIVRRLLPEFGTTYGPADDGPFPAVLILHGIEGYAGPICLSHGTEDRVWDVEMTRRLQQRLTGRDGRLEVHFDEGEDHLHRSDAENEHNDRPAIPGQLRT